MIIINFTHPLTGEQRAQIEEMAGQSVAEIIDVPAKFANGKSFAMQVAQMVNGIPLTPARWQSDPILIVPPALSFIAVTLLAELHGRMGYFPSVVRLRPMEGSTPLRYEAAEIISLQKIRNEARDER